MAEFTPGPWVLLAENEMTIVVASAEPRVDDKAFGIAIIPHHDGARRIMWATKEANATLIACAPDLLAACEFAMKVIEHGDFRNGVTDSTGSIDDGEVRVGQFYEELRALVAKATGGAP